MTSLHDLFGVTLAARRRARRAQRRGLPWVDLHTLYLMRRRVLATQLLLRGYSSLDMPWLWEYEAGANFYAANPGYMMRITLPKS